jgi:hypothetical protein
LTRLTGDKSTQIWRDLPHSSAGQVAKDVAQRSDRQSYFSPATAVQLLAKTYTSSMPGMIHVSAGQVLLESDTSRQ